MTTKKTKTKRTPKLTEPRFVQITTGQWGGSQHTLYGLSEKCQVYKWLMYEGWVLMEPKVREDED